MSITSAIAAALRILLPVTAAGITQLAVEFEKSNLISPTVATIASAALLALAVEFAKVETREECARYIHVLEQHIKDWKELALSGTRQAEQVVGITGRMVRLKDRDTDA